MMVRYLFRKIKICLGVIVALYLGAMILTFLLLSMTGDLGKAARLTYIKYISSPLSVYVIPVSSDESMIEFFWRHRSTFEAITKIQREKCLTDPETYMQRPKIRQLREDIGLGIVTEDDSLLGKELWFENPYSLEAAERTREMHKPHPSIDPRPQQCPYRALLFYWEKYGWAQFSTRWGALSKGWLYFPVPPRVENGRIYFPNYREPAREVFRQALDSLDDLPKKSWRDARECLYRKIDDRWFLFVCPLAF
jgi:hypothetical protein